MNLDELLLKVKDVSLSALVWQEDILAEEDKEKYNNNGYFIKYTKAEFESLFPELPVNCICYGPVLSGTSCLYFNRETLAVLNVPLDYSGEKGFLCALENLVDAIKDQEVEVANGNFVTSLLALQDSMRIEYFNMLIDNGKAVNNLYELFINMFSLGDYGFAAMSDEAFIKIVAAKTDKQKRETESVLSGMPDIITIYRGQTKAGTPLEKAHSWTLDRNIANFFATRRGKDKAEIITATVSKKDVVEYISDRGEKEVLVRYKDLNIVGTTELYGIETLNSLIPAVNPRYQKYKEILYTIPFDYESEIHGRLHSARVLIHTLFLSKMKGLSVADRNVLGNAALWHDTGRKNDNYCEEHGYSGYTNYKNDCMSASEKPDDIVSFLIKYHCRPDADGYKEIATNPVLNAQKKRVTMLYKIFKDADALDRVRLGIRDLDVNQLRCPESHNLTLVARICLEQIKL
ncbi:MAG: HD domain-containing protein [Agathobacter sp.]|nr:HD domain-containing protein [Agathobacter sp.]